MLEDDLKLGIFAVITAAVLFGLGTHIKAANCEQLARDTGKPHQYTIEHGCRAQYAPGVWRKVGPLQGWQELVRK